MLRIIWAHKVGGQARFLEVKMRISLKEGTKVPKAEKIIPAEGRQIKIKTMKSYGSVGTMDWGSSLVNVILNSFPTITQK